MKETEPSGGTTLNSPTNGPLSRKRRASLRRYWWLALIPLLLGAVCLLLAWPASQTNLLPSYGLSRNKEIPINLPAADVLRQFGDDLLFLGSSSDKQQRQVIAFNAAQSQERWRIDLTSSPIDAIKLQDAFIVATHLEGSDAYLLGINLADGNLIWEAPAGDSLVALDSLGNRVWAASEQGLIEINPATGRVKTSVVDWNEPGKTYALAALMDRNQEQVVLAVAAGRDIFLYREVDANWQLQWRFNASAAVFELHPIQWTADDDMHVVALARGVVFDINPDGSTAWRLDIPNSDLNQGLQKVACDRGQVNYIFHNPMGGLYLVGSQGQVRNWELPGGKLRIGLIPLPFPANVALGLTTADLNADGQDEIIARSPGNLFVFNCQGAVLAQTTLNTSQNGSYVSSLRSVPRYPPVVVDSYIVIAEEKQIGFFSFNP